MERQSDEAGRSGGLTWQARHGRRIDRRTGTGPRRSLTMTASIRASDVAKGGAVSTTHEAGRSQGRGLAVSAGMVMRACVFQKT